jgi:5'-nucleotidase
VLATVALVGVASTAVTASQRSAAEVSWVATDVAIEPGGVRTDSRPASDGGGAAPPSPVAVQVLAINDFHGALEPPGGSEGAVAGVPAGGVEYLTTGLARLSAQVPEGSTVTVAAGDLIGAAPLLSAAFHDEPAVEALGLAGLDLAGVGNHEFDEGVDELLRIQYGGCHPEDGCADPGRPYRGAGFL